MKLSIASLVLGLAGCASVSSSPAADRLEIAGPALGPDRDPQVRAPAPPIPPKPPRQEPVWNVGQPLMQGIFGVSFYNEVSREGGSTPDVDGAAGGIDEMPLIGGGGQWKLGGKGLDYGIEGLFSLEGRANAAAFAVGGGGAAVAIDVDLLVIDVYGGPFISKFLGDKLRWYAGAGPLLQFADYSQDMVSGHDHGSGFGFGGYVRTGIEMVLPSRTMIGIGGLWSDSKVDLSGGLGDLNIQGYQVFLTVTRGI